MNFEYNDAVRNGLIGAVGAIPATFAAHPFDALKIRMQVTGQTVRTALPITWSNGVYSGISAAVQQKFLTRGPMFLFSYIGTTACYNTFDISLTSATFLGSCFSGYMTGSIAAPREWIKVMSQQQLKDVAGGKRMNGAFLESIKHGTFSSALKRCHAAGVRNGIFDSIFFGLQHYLKQHFNTYIDNNANKVHPQLKYIGSGLIYAISAVSAASLDYVIDVSTKRMMNCPPQQVVQDVFVTSKNLIKTHGVLILYRGLGIKLVEMGVSYFVTGYCSVHVINYCNRTLQGLS
jgi:hypothetical protein